LAHWFIDMGFVMQCISAAFCFTALRMSFICSNLVPSEFFDDKIDKRRARKDCH
jgi:hypothetical protein